MTATVFKARVWENATVTGTGTVTLAGAAQSGYQNFAANVPSGSLVCYTIYDPSAFAWETGIGTYTITSSPAGTLTRGLQESSTGSLINFAGNTCNVTLDILSPVQTSAGAGSAGLIPALGPTGLLDSSFGSGGGWVVKTGNYTANPGDLIIATGASSQTITLPASPATDASVFVQIALLGSWSNAATISGNGKNITGDLFTNQASIRLGLDGQQVGFVYDGTVWRAFSSQGPVKLCPKVADFTWTNQGTATATDTADGLVMVDTQGGQPSNRMLTKAVSGTFNNLSVYVDYATETENYANSGPIVGNTTSGLFALQNTSQPYIYYLSLFNSPTSNSSFPVNGPTIMGPFNVFKWASNGTNITALVGRNPSGLYQTYSATLASFLLSITMVGISVDSGSSGTCNTTFSHFHQE